MKPAHEPKAPLMGNAAFSALLRVQAGQAALCSAQNIAGPIEEAKMSAPFIVHPEASRSWGGQEIRVLTELLAMRAFIPDFIIAYPPNMEKGKELITLAQRIRALSQTGLAYSANEYEIDRCQELIKISNRFPPSGSDQVHPMDAESVVSDRAQYVSSHHQSAVDRKSVV